MLYNVFLGCLFFLINNIALLYVSHLLTRRFLPKSPSAVRLVAIGTIFYALIICILQALSPFHAITKIWVTVACLFIALVAHFIWGKQRDFNADIEPIRIWLRDGLKSRWAALIIICGFVVFLSLTRALLMPPLAWDCLTYHLTFAALWIKKGTLLLFNAPDQIINCAHFPINGEIFAAWLLLPFHNDLLVNTMNFPITLLGGIACYAIARELGLTRKEASFAPALICFAPMIYVQITTAYVDNAVFAFCSAAVLFTFRYLRRGYLHDALLALTASGILLGLKYNGIPIVGLILITIIIKMISHPRQSGFLKKLILILLGLLILCTLGGRQYILNTIEAGNPLYPLSVKVLQKEIFEGCGKLEQLEEWISDDEKKSGWDKFSLWEKEYRKLCYIPLTAGPKFFIFAILALISLFARPREVSRMGWFFLAIIWIIPFFLYCADTSANIAKGGYWSDGSTRYLSPIIALFTIQALLVIKKINTYFKKIDFIIMALVAWDLFYIGKKHMWQVEVLYPFMVLMIPLVIIIFNLVRERLKLFAPKEGTFLTTTGLSALDGNITKKWISYPLVFILLVTGLHFLQNYRDNTRYRYYRGHTDLEDFPRSLVNAWVFLDQPDGGKTIAMTMDWEPPGDRWFFYPLLGRWLQNDIVYISAKNRGKVPTWFDRGLLRGDDFSIWHNNVRRKEVDYILVVKPWPVELKWMQDSLDEFQLVFSDRQCKIFLVHKTVDS